MGDQEGIIDFALNFIATELSSGLQRLVALYRVEASDAVDYKGRKEAYRRPRSVRMGR